MIDMHADTLAVTRRELQLRAEALRKDISLAKVKRDAIDAAIKQRSTLLTRIESQLVLAGGPVVSCSLAIGRY